MTNTLLRRLLRRIFIRSVLMPVFALLVVGVAASIWLWDAANSDVDQELDTTYQAAIVSLGSTLNERIASYEEIMNGALGFFAAENYDVSASDWRTYIGAMDLKERFPGLVAVSYAEVVPSSRLSEHVAQITATEVPGYMVTPPGERAVYVPLRFYEPRSDPTSNKGVGIDLYNDSTRRQAIDQARDSGEATLSDSIMFKTDDWGRPGFSVYTPVYTKPSLTVEERRSNVVGYLYASSYIAELFKGIIPEQLSQSAGMRFYEGSEKIPAKIVYQTENIDEFAKRSDLAIKTQQVKLKDKVYTVEAFVTRELIFSATKRNQPRLILITGLMASAMLAALLLLALRTRSRELSFTKQLEIQSFKDELLSLASHQLRTPATGVKQYIGMVLQGYAGDITREQRGMLEKANTSNERQLEIVDQILHVTKLEAGNIRLRGTRINLTNLISDVIEEQAYNLKERKHKVVFAAKRPVYVHGDQQYLRMVMENLLSNASKYMKSRGKITIVVRNQRDVVTVDVSDTGVGIEPEDYPKLFQKFSRIDNELSIQAGGSGIGLYLASLIMAQHGGSIEAIANPRKGTTFRVVLPKRSG